MHEWEDETKGTSRVYGASQKVAGLRRSRFEERSLK